MAKSKINYDQYGIKTTGLTKPLLVGCLTEFINEDHTRLKSRDLISQLSGMFRTNAGTIKSNSYSDLFMAASFCAYARKRKAIEILPLISFSNHQLEQKFLSEVQTIAGMMTPASRAKTGAEQDAAIYTSEEQIVPIENVGDDDLSMFMPFFTE